VNESIPIEVQPLLNRLIAAFRHTLASDLVGVYLHGSLAMGCFNPASSDVDMLVVAKREVELETKRRIGEALVALSEDAPPGGIELSVVTGGALRAFAHPMPFELHYSKRWRDDYAAGRVDLTHPRRDADLAAHITVTKRRGVTLWGEPLASVFPEVPWRYYLASIVEDSESSLGNVLAGPDAGSCRVPPYAVINFCRVLAAAQERLVLSKREGGEWALPRLAAADRRIVEAALRAYGSGRDEWVDAAELKAFAEDIWTRIQSRL
jgi:streptomycin 3"-adenylyltransferase